MTDVTRRPSLYPEGSDCRWRRYEWQIMPGVPQEPAMNLALDEVLMTQLAEGNRPPLLRFWSWASPCVVLGRFQSVSNEMHTDRAEELGIPAVRRISGGGAMLIEPESAITYSLYVPPAMVEGLSFPESYAFLDGWVVQALRGFGIDAWYEPLNDISSSGGKIGGAAQARRYGSILHHTTMAYDMTAGLLTQVLRIGEEKIRDKGIRSAAARVGPLRQQTQLERDVILQHLHDHFTEQTAATPTELTDDELKQARSLVNSKFGTEEWTFLLP